MKGKCGKLVNNFGVYARSGVRNKWVNGKWQMENGKTVGRQITFQNWNLNTIVDGKSAFCWSPANCDCNCNCNCNNQPAVEIITKKKKTTKKKQRETGLPKGTVTLCRRIWKIVGICQILKSQITKEPRRSPPRLEISSKLQQVKRREPGWGSPQL